MGENGQADGAGQAFLGVCSLAALGSLSLSLAPPVPAGTSAHRPRFSAGSKLERVRPAKASLLPQGPAQEMNPETRPVGQPCRKGRLPGSGGLAPIRD